MGAWCNPKYGLKLVPAHETSLSLPTTFLISPIFFCIVPVLCSFLPSSANSGFIPTLPAISVMHPSPCETVLPPDPWRWISSGFHRVIPPRSNIHAAVGIPHLLPLLYRRRRCSVHLHTSIDPTRYQQDDQNLTQLCEQVPCLLLELVKDRIKTGSDSVFILLLGRMTSCNLICQKVRKQDTNL